MKLPVPREILSQHVAILGKTRSGKSSVMRLLVEDLLERQLPVCIVDPKGDWYGLKLSADGKGPGYPVVIFGGEHADIPINEHAGAHVAELFATGNRPCLIDLGGWMPGPRTKFWIDFASTLFKHTKGDRWLAVDEIHNFAPKGKVFDVEAGKALHWTNRLASEGLGKGVAMLFASQRPQKVHNDTLTSAETLIAMRVLHPSDRGAVADWIKGCGDSEGSEVLNSLAQMDRGEGWVWSPEIGFGPKRVKFPFFSTYDSFRPQSVADTKKLKGWAEVNLDDVRAKMSATIEKAKADDPRELRKTIAALNKQVASKVDSPSPQPAKVIEKPVLKDSQILAIDKALGRLEATIEKAATVLTKPFASVREQLGALTAAVQSVRQPALPMASASVERRSLPSGRVAAPRPPAPPRVPPSGGNNGDAGLSRAAERKVLTVLAQYPQGRTVRQVAVLAGYAMNGGGFRNAVGKLRSLGYLDGNHAGLVITDAGIAALGDWTPLPTGAALAGHWLSQLDRKAEREVLQVLLDAYPDALTAEDIAAKTPTGYEANGGGFRNALGKLKTLEIVDADRGAYRASAELFS